MKKSFIIPLTLLALAASVAGGCKKEETTKSSLDGSLSIVMPKYVEPGFTKTFCIDTMTTLSRPDGAAIGYYFSDPFLASNDTIVKADGSVNRNNPHLQCVISVLEPEVEDGRGWRPPRDGF